MSSSLHRIHERYLRHIWSRQYLDQSALCTTDGRSVRVHAVGRLNDGSGPDFLGARIRIGKTTYVGDVEIHRDVSEWIAHQHQHDPRYNQVILHVVLEAREPLLPTVTKSGRSIPILVLEPFLNESPQAIWRRAVLEERSYRRRSIRCSEYNDACEPPLLQSLLDRMSEERSELKIRRFGERLRQLAAERIMLAREPWKSYFRTAGEGKPQDIPPPVPELRERELRARRLWDQVLYEGLMEGLGYSRNRDPFLRLARSVSLEHAAYVLRTDGMEGVEAVLYGAAGLFPRAYAALRKESRRHARRLRRTWTRLRTVLRIEQVHPADWVFSPTRPSNFPTLRVAAAAQLVEKILRGDLFRGMIRIFASEADPVARRRSLHELLAVSETGPGKGNDAPGHPLQRMPAVLGRSRIDDLIVNTVIPISSLYARTFDDREVGERASELSRSYPPLSANSVTRLIYNQLLKGKLRLDGMARQQGAIQLYRYYCVEERCAECDVGKKVFPQQVAPEGPPARV